MESGDGPRLGAGTVRRPITDMSEPWARGIGRPDLPPRAAPTHSVAPSQHGDVSVVLMWQLRAPGVHGTVSRADVALPFLIWPWKL